MKNKLQNYLNNKNNLINFSSNSFDEKPKSLVNKTTNLLKDLTNKSLTGIGYGASVYLASKHLIPNKIKVKILKNKLINKIAKNGESLTTKAGVLLGAGSTLLPLNKLTNKDKTKTNKTKLNK